MPATSTSSGARAFGTLQGYGRNFLSMQPLVAIRSAARGQGHAERAKVPRHMVEQNRSALHRRDRLRSRLAGEAISFHACLTPPARPGELDQLDNALLVLGHTRATDRHEGQVPRVLRPYG